MEWLGERLQSERCRIYIAETENGEAVGQVRFDVGPDGSARVGTSVAAGWRGRGLGVAVIRRSCEAFRLEHHAGIVVANVRPENIASLRTFERAGFLRVGTEQVAGCESVRMELVFDAPVLFRPDAGAGVGLGHLQRCLALAEALRTRRIASAFMARGAAADRVRAHGFDVIDASPAGTLAEDGDQIRAAAISRRSQAIVLDSYQVDAEYLDRVTDAAAVVAVIDDLARFPFSADLVINGGACAADLGYRSSTGQTQFLLGPEHVLLQPAFWDRADTREIGQVRRVLVTVGGSDAHDLMPRLVQAVDDVSASFEMTVVIGPFFEHRDAFDVALRRCQHDVATIDAPEDLAGVMRAADLAVSSAGQTLYELASVGTPVVAVQSADNQAANVRGLDAAGAIRFAGPSGDPSLRQKVSSAVRDLIGDRDARQRMADAGRGLVDGRGALRVADAMLAMMQAVAGRHA